MLAPQFLGYLPAGLLPALISSASSTAATTSGSPLPSGTVTYQNTWNNTLAYNCGTTSIVSAEQPLVSVQGSWTKTLQIPSQTFMEQPSGDPMNQTYTVFENGTFAMSDQYGNAYSWKLLPISSSPASISGSALDTTTLIANSTFAVQDDILTSATHVVANVSVSYGIRDQYCQPAGLKITISGSANWGIAKTGNISLSFNTPMIPVATQGVNASYQAWFGNASGVSIGFDWSDSRSMNPAFNVGARTLSWSVGSSFTIDPITMTSINQTMFGRWTHDIWHAAGLWWFFYPSYNSSSGNGNYYLKYASSSNESTWNFTGKASPSHGAPILYDVLVSGKDVYYALVDNKTTNGFYYRHGTLLNGTINWAAPETLVGIDYSIAFTAPSIAINTNGEIFVSVSAYSGANHGCTCYTEAMEKIGSYWYHSTTISKTVPAISQLLEDTNVSDGGDMTLVRCYPCLGSSQSYIDVSTFVGGTWTDSVAKTTLANNFTYFEAVSAGNADYIAFDEYNSSNSGVKVFNYTIGQTSFGSKNMVYPISPGESVQSTIGSDSQGNLYVTVGSITKNTVQIFKSWNGGNTWYLYDNVSSIEKSQIANSLTQYYTTSNLTAIAWQVGTTSPYNVRFASLPAIVPNAADSGQPWAKPGLSPFEEYFTNLNEYVSPGNGLLGIKQLDLTIPGRGMDLSIARVFSTPYAFQVNSSYTIDYDNNSAVNFGLGWSLDFPWLGTNYIHLQDGQVYGYNWTGNTVTNHNGGNFELIKNTNASFTLYTSDGTEYYFDKAKQLTSITDPFGNAIQFAYSSANGVLANITDTIGRVVTFTNNSNSEITSMSSSGRTWKYGYSGSELVNMTDPLGRVTSYQYNTSLSPWLIDAVLYPTGAKTTYSYAKAPVGTDAVTYYVTLQNSYSSPTALVRATSFNYHIVDGKAQWSNSTISDGTNVRSHENYNYQNSTKSQRYETDGQGNLIRKYVEQYTNYGEIWRTDMYSPSNSLLAYTLSSFDNWGNTIFTQDNSGHNIWYSYSNTNDSNAFHEDLPSCGFPGTFYTNTVNPNIHTALLGQAQYQKGTNGCKGPQETFYLYNYNGEPIQTEIMKSGAPSYYDIYSAYDGVGNMITSTDAAGRETYYQYSSAYEYAYLTQSSIIVSGQNVSTAYTYNYNTGWKTSVTDPNNQTTFYSYDNLGRLLSVAYPLVNGVASETVYSYNDTGNYITITDANGNVQKQYFDGLERQLATALYNGTALYSMTNTTYNWVDQPATTTTAVGNKYTYTYDSLGRLNETINPDGTHQTVSYDDTNNVKTVTDANGHVTQFGSDWMNRLIWVKEYYTPTAYYTTSYTYDDVGNLNSTSDPNGQVTSYQYDLLNRLTMTTFPDGTNNTKSYDRVGNLITSTDGVGNKISYAYDALNRLTNITYPNHSIVTYTYDKAGNRLSEIDSVSTSYYQYDARGRLTNETDVINGTGYTIFYTYDKVGNILSAKYPDGYSITYGDDSLNRVTRLGMLANFTYTLDNEINSIRYGNGILTTYSYDSRDRPTNILSMSNATKLLDLNYSYDAVGNILSINTQNYTYDFLNRLISSTGPWGKITYAYDGAGNMLNMTQGSATTTYKYGPYNNLIRVGNSTSFWYDSNGNMIKQVNGTNTWKYSYDYTDRLTNVTLNGQVVQVNKYNSDGKRVSVTDNASTTLFIYEGANIVYDKNLTTGAVTDHFYANGLQIAALSGSTASYIISDILGSARLVKTQSLATSFSSDYKPFGLNYGLAGLSNFMYTGKWEDGITGLYYFGARFYDPSIERFVTEDTNMGNKEDPLSLNRYIYARDNPMSITDPTGHDWWGSLTSAVSNAVGTISSAANAVVSTVASGVNTAVSAVASLPSAASHAWSGMTPRDRAYVAAAAIIAVSAVAIVASAGLLAPVVVPLAIAPAVADISATVIVGDATYVALNSNPTDSGVCEQTVDSAVSSGISRVSASLPNSAGGFANAASSVSGDLAGAAVQSGLTHTSFASNINQNTIAINAVSAYQMSGAGDVVASTETGYSEASVQYTTVSSAADGIISNAYSSLLHFIFN
ncbi:MAG: RHS repeat-associated core domain-containing protein [Nitrososphaerales archaeon]